MYDAMMAEAISITGHGGDWIEAYLARPLDRGPRGGVVVIHHLPGYDPQTKEITRTFAVHGYNAICPNLYSREAPGASHDDAAAAVRARGGIPDDQLVGDVEGAAAQLRAMPGSNGKAGVIGYCSGGRQSFLAACRLQLDAAVDCYGGRVFGSAPDDALLKVPPVANLAPSLSCPLLGLFGAEDRSPSPDEVAELDKVLTEAGKAHEFHSYEGAGHAFFAVNRAAYRPEAAMDGWAKILDFFGRHLAS